jgi:hypothetical protein
MTTDGYRILPSRGRFVIVCRRTIVGHAQTRPLAYQMIQERLYDESRKNAPVQTRRLVYKQGSSSNSKKG